MRTSSATKRAALGWGVLGVFLLIIGVVAGSPALYRRRGSPSYVSPESIARSQNMRRVVMQGESAWRDRKDYNEAERLFREAISLQPGFSLHKRLIEGELGEMLAEQGGREKEAFLLYKRALLLEPPKNSQIQISRDPNGFAPTDLSKYARFAQNAGESREAEWAIKEIVYLSSERYPEYPKFSRSDDLSSVPVDGMADLVLGLYYEKATEYRKALSLFQSVTKRYPRIGLAHLCVGRTLPSKIGVGNWREPFAKPVYLEMLNSYRKAVKFGNAREKATAKKKIEEIEHFLATFDKPRPKPPR